MSLNTSDGDLLTDTAVVNNNISSNDLAFNEDRSSDSNSEEERRRVTSTQLIIRLTLRKVSFFCFFHDSTSTELFTKEMVVKFVKTVN